MEDKTFSLETKPFSFQKDEVFKVTTQVFYRSILFFYILALHIAVIIVITKGRSLSFTLGIIIISLFLEAISNTFLIRMQAGQYMFFYQGKKVEIFKDDIKIRDSNLDFKLSDISKVLKRNNGYILIFKINNWLRQVFELTIAHYKLFNRNEYFLYLPSNAFSSQESIDDFESILRSNQLI